jgi:hypothetical protein
MGLSKSFFYGAKRHIQEIGDGTNLTYTVTHNFNSRDVGVQIRETAAPHAEIYADVSFTELNSIDITFELPAPITNQYTVIVVA